MDFSCAKCLRPQNDNIECLGCYNYFCNDCIFMCCCMTCREEVCHRCSEPRFMNSFNYKKCKGCNIGYCCGDSYMINFKGVFNDVFCDKKCVSVELYRKYLIIELNTKFRRRKLREHLRRYNIKKRKDSVLCTKYINNTLDKEWTAEKVAQKMCEMKYLYDYCRMNHYLKLTSVNKFSGLTHFEISKHLALRNYGQFPVVWPWSTLVKDEHQTKLKESLNMIKIMPPKGYFLGGTDFHELNEINKQKYGYK